MQAGKPGGSLRGTQQEHSSDGPMQSPVAPANLPGPPPRWPLASANGTAGMHTGGMRGDGTRSDARACSGSLQSVTPPPHAHAQLHGEDNGRHRHRHHQAGAAPGPPASSVRDAYAASSVAMQPRASAHASARNGHRAGGHRGAGEPRVAMGQYGQRDGSPLSSEGMLDASASDGIEAGEL